MQAIWPVGPPIEASRHASCADVIAATKSTSEAEKTSVRDDIMKNINSIEPAPCACGSHNHYSYSINIP